MLPENPHGKSMALTLQEALDLLDLCVLSPIEPDPDKDRVIEKLSAFVRTWILDEQTAAGPSACL